MHLPEFVPQSDVLDFDHEAGRARLVDGTTVRVTEVLREPLHRVVQPPAGPDELDKEWEALMANMPQTD